MTIRYGPGKGLRLNPSGANLGYALGTTEPAIQAVLATHVQPGDVVWDIGANVGFFTLICARLVGSAGRVVAVDPLPDNAAALRSNLGLNRFENVDVIEMAMSDHAGRGRLHLLEEPTWAKLDTPETGFEDGRSIGSIEVNLGTLDSLLDTGLAPALVKVDIEGAEVAALRGAARLLGGVRPKLVLECHGTNEGVADLLESAGYELAVVGSELPVRAAPWDAHVLALPRA